MSMLCSYSVRTSVLSHACWERESHSCAALWRGVWFGSYSKYLSRRVVMLAVDKPSPEVPAKGLWDYKHTSLLLCSVFTVSTAHDGLISVYTSCSTWVSFPTVLSSRTLWMRCDWEFRSILERRAIITRHLLWGWWMMRIWPWSWQAVELPTMDQ